MSAPEVQPSPGVLGGDPAPAGQPDTSSLPTSTQADPSASLPTAVSVQPTPQKGQMWKAVLMGALAGLQGAGAKTFSEGVGEGATAAAKMQQQARLNARADQQQASDIRFKDLESAHRAAALHQKDQELAIMSREEQDKRQTVENARDKMYMDRGYDVTQIPNSGEAAHQTLVASTSAAMAAGQNGASIPAGTSVSPQSIHVPNFSAPFESQYKLYSDQAKFLNQLPVSKQAFSELLPAGRLKVLAEQGHVLSGTEQTTGQFLSPERLYYAKSNMEANIKRAQGNKDTDPNMLAVAKASLDSMNTALEAKHQHESQLIHERQQTKDASAPNQTKEAMAELKLKQAQGSADEWRPGADATAKNKGRLGENVGMNTNEIASILQRRPDLFGAIAGRYTQIEQMIGNNDPDINAMGMAVQNLAKSNGGLHGMRSHENALHTEQTILNSFKSGPKAVMGALRVNMNSAQTFIDSARPDSYRTHSKNGGAIRAMLPTN